MARPTRSAKRKRPDDDHEPAPQKQLRHLDKQHAAAILDVLAMLDSQGLLDRVFPVHAHPTRSAALRTLLAEQQPLDVLRAAVQHLQPISAVPRATLSPTAAQQHRFCALATDLLDQASVPVLLDHASASASPACPRPLKYALVQHLPNQDYWSSLTALPLNTLPTAHAELVAVLPTPSAQPDPRPTLAAYAAAPSPQSIKPLPQQRTVTTGAFLDFGPWASFAPTFDHDGEVVARNELALALYASHRVRRIAAAREPPDVQDPPPRPARAPVDLESELHELLPPEDAAAVKSALDVLQLEAAVQELLDRNRAALLRLEHLQTERIIADAPVEEGSEEWDTAQGILDTLTVLASLRPRSTGAKTIVPPPPILHRLHRTLAVAPSPGWHGTLPAARPAALADDTTFKKSSRAVPPPPAATPAPTPAAAPAVTAPVALPYSGYTYAYGQQGQAQPYRPASTSAAGASPANGYSQYASQYYAYTPPQQGQQQNYYAGQQQGYTAASYSTWYNSLYNAQGSSSGKSTPQPQPQPQAGTYGSFFGTQARTPAVANTVYGAGATVPSHLRTQMGSGQQQYYTK